MRKSGIFAIVGAVILVSGFAMLSVSCSKKVNAQPAFFEDVQYPFEKGGGLINLAAEDVFIGVGMLMGEKDKEDARAVLTGSVNFEPASAKTQARIQMDRIRLIERTLSGDGRVFEPEKIYDSSMEKGREPKIRFLETRGKFPFAWENGMKGYIYFAFAGVPDDLQKADLVLTYNGKFPGKKHLAYYESRLPVERKVYRRRK